MTNEPGTEDERAVGHLRALLARADARVQELEQDLARSERLRRDADARTAVDRRLVDCARDGGGLAALVRTCSHLTGKPVTLFDHDGRRTMSAHVTSTTVPTPPLADILDSLESRPHQNDRVHVANAALGGSLSRRKMIASVHAGGERFGWLVLDEHPAAFGAVDEFVVARSAQLLAHEYGVQKRIARVAWNARSSLTRQLIRGTNESADLASSAEYLGVDIDADRVVVYVQDADRVRTSAVLDQALAARLERALEVEVLATRGSDGVMLLVEAPRHSGALTSVARVKSAAAQASSTIPSFASAIIGVSSVCTPATLARGYREAREVVLCIDRFAQLTDHRVMAVDDLGPARLFLANSSTTAVTHYVDDVLGPLLTGTPGTADLLVTLQHYFDASRSVRTSAARLGLHENTVRLRLARVHGVTGLDVASDANDQLSVQTALLLLRLQGHPALPTFGNDGVDGEPGRKFA
ncbi:PucR family transcriptional regulator [Rhodococcoides kyotonense]|uniref:PucR C-terminal helix-turn-helix domain-containing protein n=1 Tax=Rhodococcoides kyotonense TaxID=398843 RepID=A0A239JZ24_9NOCA|nr:helix-turn-helix domain-containing protein [Rhodococcus kyotonensis]SNT11267.1 PucR C-terminal helix-turn-helix domain-containing protein [Rhodococcus kyotonensis]